VRTLSVRTPRRRGTAHAANRPGWSYPTRPAHINISTSVSVSISIACNQLSLGARRTARHRATRHSTARRIIAAYRRAHRGAALVLDDVGEGVAVLHHLRGARQRCGSDAAVMSALRRAGSQSWRGARPAHLDQPHLEAQRRDAIHRQRDVHALRQPGGQPGRWVS
jgi:hypothetical protein